MKGLDPTAVEDADGIEKAAAMVHSLIEEEINRGISSHRIIVGGFSQGGALSLYSSLRSERALGGVVALYLVGFLCPLISRPLVVIYYMENELGML